MIKQLDHLELFKLQLETKNREIFTQIFQKMHILIFQAHVSYFDFQKLCVVTVILLANIVKSTHDTYFDQKNNSAIND